jgi:hypothetical protein
MLDFSFCLKQTSEDTVARLPVATNNFYMAANVPFWQPQSLTAHKREHIIIRNQEQGICLFYIILFPLCIICSNALGQVAFRNYRNNRILIAQKTKHYKH